MIFTFLETINEILSKKSYFLKATDNGKLCYIKSTKTMKFPDTSLHKMCKKYKAHLCSWPRSSGKSLFFARKLTPEKVPTFRIHKYQAISAQCLQFYSYLVHS